MDPNAMNPLAILAGMGTGMIIFMLAINVFMIVVSWKIYTKAGKPGWACLIPIYNIVVFFQIVQRPMWWLALFLSPIIGSLLTAVSPELGGIISLLGIIVMLVMSIILVLDLAKVFGKNVGFGLGLLFLGIIFMPLLAFSDAKYVGRQQT